MFSNCAKYEGFTKYDGFATYGYDSNIITGKSTNPNILSSNLDAIVSMETDISGNSNTIQANKSKIADSVTEYNSRKQFLLENNAMYDYRGNTFFYKNRDKKTEDVILEDTDKLLLHQNMMYITGSVAAVSLLIIAIFVGAKP